jgi:hypothetical protein
MTTYTSISNTLVAVGAKPFASTIQALRDNPIAIAEGDDTAPRIVARARAFEFLPRVSGFGTTAVGYTDLDPKNLYFFIVGQATDGFERNLQVRGSNNNGSTWSDWFTILTSSSIQTSFSLYLNNVTGIVSSNVSANQNLGVTSINAFQVRHFQTGASHSLVGHAVSRGDIS